MIQILSLRHAYPEKAGFRLRREAGHAAYTFLHFHNSVQIEVGGVLCTTAPHAVIIYRPGTPQFFYSPTLLVHDWIHFSGTIDPILEQAGLKPDKIYYPSRNQFITELVWEMETEAYSSRRYMERILNLKMEELFLKLGRSVLDEEEPDILCQAREQFRFLRGEIFSSLNEPWTVERMAQMAHLSTARFHAIYKNVFGISPTADLINARMDSARNLLSFSEKSVTEIAAELGYRNVTHFIRQFRERNGVSPSAYRKSFWVPPDDAGQLPEKTKP